MGMKIMVVDDQPEVAALIKSAVESFGCEAVTFSNGQEASERLLREYFDAVFVDTHTPDLDGYDLTKLIRATKWKGKVPVVMVAEQDDHEAMRLAFSAGATSFLGKPITVERVQGVFKSLLGPIQMERRRNKRVYFETLVSCTSGDDRRRSVARSANLSINGMLLEGLEGVKVGDSLGLEFFLPSSDTPLRISATVARLAAPNAIGVYFINLSDLCREALDAFIFPTQAAVAPKPGGNQESPTKVETIPAVAGKQPRSAIQTGAYILGALLVLYLTYQLVSHFSAPASATSAESGQGDGRAGKTPQAVPSQPVQPGTAGIQSPSLTLTPAVIFVPRDGGRTISETLVLNNQSSQDLAFDLAAEDMVTGEGRMFPDLASPSPNGIASSVAFSVPTVIAKAWRTVSFQVTLNVPPRSPSRGVLIVLKGNRAIRAAGGIALQPSLGTLIAFVDPGPPVPPTGPAARPPDILPSYTVSQWPGE